LPDIEKSEDLKRYLAALVAVGSQVRIAINSAK